MTKQESMLVDLTFDEIQRSGMIGLERHLRDLENGKAREDGWDLHINAAIGELVIAKWRRQNGPGSTGDDQGGASGQDEEPDPPGSTTAPAIARIKGNQTSA